MRFQLSKTLASFLALVLGGLPAIAQNDVFVPYLAQVSGLTAGDHLNVRYEPTSKSKDLGDLGADTIVEVLEHGNNDRWARIIWEEGSGFVSRAYLTELTPETGKLDLDRDLECLGTEPFWTLRVFKNGNVTFKALDGIPLVAELSEIEGSFSAPAHAQTFLTNFFSAKVAVEQCSDGMSDRIYGYGVTTVIEGRPLTGCCSQIIPR